MSRLRKIILAALDEADDSIQSGAQRPLHPDEPRLLSGEDRDGFLAAARQREPAAFAQLDAFAAELSYKHPLRAQKFRRELKWVLRQARRNGIEWH